MSGSMLILVVTPLCVRDTVVSVGAVEVEPTRLQLEFPLPEVADSSEDTVEALVLGPLEGFLDALQQLS